MPIGFGVVATNVENFRHEALPWPALQLDEDVQGIGDIALGRATGQFDSALQNAACEPRKGFCSGACVSRRERPRVTGAEIRQVFRVPARRDGASIRAEKKFKSAEG